MKRLLIALLFFAAQPLAAAFVSTSGGALSVAGRPLAIKGLEAQGAAQALATINGAKAQGANLLHVSLDSLSKSTFPGIPSEQGWREADRLLDAAARAGVYLAFSFTSANPGGGLNRSTKALGGQGEGLYFVDGRARDWYLYILRTAATRVNTVNGRKWKDDPTILGWLLGARLDDPDDPQGGRVSNWAKQSATILKGLDRNHLVGLAWSGTGVPEFTKLAALDFVAVPPSEAKRVSRATAKPALSFSPSGAKAASFDAALPEGKLLLLSNVKLRSLSPQEAELSFTMSEAAVPSVDFGLDGLLDKVVDGPKATTAKLALHGLRPGSSYLLKARARTSDGRVASGMLLRLDTGQLSRKPARPSASSQNIIVARGGRFWDGNKPFRYVGANNYYLRYTDRPAAIAEVLDSAREMGMKVIRCQANGESFKPLQAPYEVGRNFVAGSPHGYVEESFRHYDMVMAEAAKRGLRITLYMADNWEYAGGAAVWAKWHGKKKNAFFSDPTIKAEFKGLIRQWVTRRNTVNGRYYKDDPTLFTWELINEPRDEDDTSSKTVAAWAAEMSAYIKSMDARHMVATGLEGQIAEGGSHYSGADYLVCQRAPTIDYATFHFYPVKEFRKLNLKSAVKMIKDYVKMAHEDLKKPVVMEEFGVEKRYEGELNRFEWTSTMAEAFYKAGGDGSSYWQLIDKDYKGLDGYEFHRDDLEYYNLFSRLSDEVNR